MTPADALTSTTPYTPEQRILHALAFGERTKGELLDASGLNSYHELDAVLAQMGDKVSRHWPPVGYSTYRLAEVKRHFPRWMLPPKPE